MKLTFRRLEIAVSFCLFFLGLLILQSLVLEKGYFGNSLVFFLKDYIGYFGVWVLTLFFFVFSWLIGTQRNIDLLLKQSKHKALVAFDLIKHYTLVCSQHIQTFFLHIKTRFLPYLQRFFSKKERQILDLQNMTQERIQQASYDFKDVLIEESFDEAYKPNPKILHPLQENTQNALAPSSTPPVQPILQQPQEQPDKKPRLEVVQATGEELKLEEFFKLQIAKHKNILDKLSGKRNIALTDPVLTAQKPTLLTQDLQHPQSTPPEPVQKPSKTISAPPPRPLNPNAFLQSTTPPQNTQKYQHIADENLKASQSLEIPADLSLESLQSTQNPPIESISNENIPSVESSPQVPTLPNQTPIQPPIFTPIEPLTNNIQDSSPATKESMSSDEVASPSENTPDNISNQSPTSSAYTPPQIFPQNTPLELDIQEISSPEDNNESKEWANDIAQEIPAQTPTKPTYQRITELDENTSMLNNLEYGKVDKPKYFRLPLTSFLNQPQNDHTEIDENEIDRKIEDLLAKLKMFRVEGDIVRTYSGPIVTTFEFRPAPHVKVSKILTLEDDLAMALRARSIRIQAPIPGKDVVGIEIPNNTTQTIYLREILESDLFKTSASPLTLALGKDIIGNPFITDLRKAPHLLIAGTTGSGKSVGLNAMILSLLYKNTPENLKLLMVDPKKVEFSIYADIPHLITPIISQPKKAIIALNSAVVEMERRLDLMSEIPVRDIDSYNRKMTEEGGDKFPYLVVIIDELADLMMTGGKEVEFALARIAQMGRASGIHLIVATQRPSVDVITGLIKANLPSRISYKVGTKIDSKVILDSFGAESLLGRGDMLFKLEERAIRLHAPWSTEEEIEKITAFIKEQQPVNYDKSFILEERDEGFSYNDKENGDNGDLIAEAKKIILQDRKTSGSHLQRRLSIGYNKAANIIEQLEREGFLSAPNAKGAREIRGQ